MAGKAKSFSKDKLKQFEEILLAKRAKLAKEIDYLERTATMQDSGGDSGYTSHLADEGSDFNSMETNFDLIQREGKFLKYVEEAIERIHKGTFGICKVCNELIEEERLMAVPTTTTHVDCKKQVKVKEQAALEREKIKEALARQQMKVK